VLRPCSSIRLLDDTRHRSIRCMQPVVRRGNFAIKGSLVQFVGISSFAFRHPIASYAPRLLPMRNDLGKRKNRSLHAGNRANIPPSRYGSGDQARMQSTKLEKGPEHKRPIRRSVSVDSRDQPETTRSTGKKATHNNGAQKEAKSERSLRKIPGNQSNSDKLVCRYCGSDDLSPSFIKRRDRRCRKCFSKRYGSAAPARKANIQK
jgi:hypothetical protein